MRLWISSLVLLLSATSALARGKVDDVKNHHRNAPSEMTLVECNWGDFRSLFEIDNAKKTIKDGESDVDFDLIFFKPGLVKFRSNNPFYANQFAPEGKFPAEVEISINRVSGVADSQVYSKENKIEYDLADPQSRKYGKCRLVHHQF
jgi:hypothetical protein